MTPQLVDVSGRPLTARTVPQGILNENAHHWTRYQVDAYYNPDSISLSTYEQMYNTDETCFSGIEFLIMSAVAQIGEYGHPVPRIQEFVQRQLVEMRGSFAARIAEVMTAAPFGFSLTEIIWKVKGREVGLSDLQTLHPATIHLDLHRSGPLKNQPRCAWQFFRRDKQVLLPLDKCILYSHGASFGNAYGTSRLKRAYKSWYIKDKILMAWALTCERYGSPYTVGKTSANTQVIDPATGQQISAAQNMLNVLNSFGPRGSGVIDLNDVIEVTYAGSGYGTDFENLVAYCNKMIYRAIGLPSLIADHGNSGSYSLGQQHFKLFILVLERLLFEVLDVLIEQLIRPLIVMNFGEQDDYGDFAVEDFSPEDARTIAETAEILARGGFISAAKIEDCNIIRERTGMPLWAEEDFEPSVPPAVTDTEEPSTERPTEDEIDESREIAKVYNFSNSARMRRAVETRRKRWRGSRTEEEIDRMAALLSRFTA